MWSLADLRPRSARSEEPLRLLVQGEAFRSSMEPMAPSFPNALRLPSAASRVRQTRLHASRLDNRAPACVHVLDRPSTS